MENSTNAGLDYAHEKIGHLFRKIFFPTLWGMIFNALITIIDGVFVGQGVGPDGIAAVNIIAPVYMVCTGIGLMLGIGASVTAGMALAEGAGRKANAIVSQAFISASAVMLICMIAGLCFPERVALLMGSSRYLLPYTTDYLRWILPAALFISWSSIGMMVIRLDGSPKYAMLINIIPAVLNIIGDYILIFPLGMGVKGAAIATMGSIAVGGVMALAYFRFSYIIKLKFDLSDIWRHLQRVTAIGSSAFVTEIAMSVMMLTGNYIFMRDFGDTGVAAYSIACYLFPLIFMMSNAVAQSAQPIISYNVGIRQPERVMEAFRMSRRIAFYCGLVIFAGISLGSKWIVNLFIPLDSPAGMLAAGGLPMFSACAVFFSLNIAYIGFCQSLGRASLAMAYTLLRGIVILVPLFFLMPSLVPGWGIWGAIPLSEILTFLIILLPLKASAPQSARA